MTTALWPLNIRDGFTRGYAGGGYFHDKTKNIRDKMSNLGNNMMISKLFVNNNYNWNTVVKQDFAVVK
jgi:hypothetical protein